MDAAMYDCYLYARMKMWTTFARTGCESVGRSLQARQIEQRALMEKVNGVHRIYLFLLSFSISKWLLVEIGLGFGWRTCGQSCRSNSMIQPIPPYLVMCLLMNAQSLYVFYSIFVYSRGVTKASQFIVPSQLLPFKTLAPQSHCSISIVSPPKPYLLPCA